VPFGLLMLLPASSLAGSQSPTCDNGCDTFDGYGVNNRTPNWVKIAVSSDWRSRIT
jgi:hypothetical protein